MTSLRDLAPDNTDVVVGSLCTGYGGLDRGLLAALGGGRIAWVADPDPHVSSILATRMPGVPNLGDVRDIDWATVEPVDVVTAGFPCQDISAAGRRAGIEKGERSGIWSDIVAGIRVLRPALLVVENVAALRWKGGGLHRVLGDLAEAGYDAVWRSVRASDVGCAHRRERVFLLAWSQRGYATAADTDRARWQFQRHQRGEQTRRPVFARPTAVAADTDGRGQRVGGDSDCAPLGSADAQGMRDSDGLRSTAAGHSEPGVDWGEYTTAVRRWESLLGRDIPFPTQRGQHGRPVLSPALVEHLMGLPVGWVTDLPLPRTAQLRALGNGVVPQQAAYALALLLADLAEVLVGGAPIGHGQEATAA